MSTSWSDMILRFIDDGETHETIIAYFNNPVVNTEYINTVITSRMKLLRRDKGQYKNLRTKAPPEGTQQRFMYDYAMSLGGIDKFKELIKTRTLMSIAKELNVPKYYVINFKRQFIKMNKVKPWLEGASNLTNKIRNDQIRAGTYVKKPKRVSLKEVRNLW